MPEAVPAALHSAPLTPTEVRTLQDALNRLGYPAGTPDGIFGARTGAALAAWLSDHRMIQQRRPLRALLAMIRAELAKVSRPTTADARPIAAR
jgi:peptidoglycan hydrolase-like protein with peptidoglycan-binding domain